MMARSLLSFYIRLLIQILSCNFKSWYLCLSLLGLLVDDGTLVHIFVLPFHIIGLNKPTKSLSHKIRIVAHKHSLSLSSLKSFSCQDVINFILWSLKWWDNFEDDGVSTL